MSQQNFRALGVSANVAGALEARGFHTPFRIQNLVLPDALAGRDVLAKSPTGSGKTLAFALPIVERTAAADARPSALVLALSDKPLPAKPASRGVEMGVDRLELSTFRLSSECSNQLSYTPPIVKRTPSARRAKDGGPDRSRTGNFLLAKQAFSH